MLLRDAVTPPVDDCGGPVAGDVTLVADVAETRGTAPRATTLSAD